MILREKTTTTRTLPWKKNTSVTVTGWNDSTSRLCDLKRRNFQVGKFNDCSNSVVAIFEVTKLGKSVKGEILLWLILHGNWNCRSTNYAGDLFWGKYRLSFPCSKTLAPNSPQFSVFLTGTLVTWLSSLPTWCCYVGLSPFLVIVAARKVSFTKSSNLNM